MTQPTGATILIAEDDQQIRTALERILGYEGYSTIAVGDGAAALAAVAEHRPDAVLLDVMMPHVDGISACRRLRDRGDRTPILMLTARHELPDRVAGLDAGADDYLPKPFELDELLARVRALLRRSADAGERPLEVGDLRLDPRRHEVHRDGSPLELTRTEFRILELLMANAGLVMSRTTLYERIWGYDLEASSRSLDVHVGYLRRKLEAGGRPRVIETVRGVGFVLRVTGGPGRPGGSTGTGDTGDSGDAGHSGHSGHSGDSGDSGG